MVGHGEFECSRRSALGDLTRRHGDAKNSLVLAGLTRRTALLSAIAV